MSNRKRPRRRPSKYPPEFQRGAVAMVLDEHRSIADVARSIGVNEGTLGNWVAKARRERGEGVGLDADERAERRSCAPRTLSSAWSVTCSNDRCPSG
jgi:transposase-like protein